jgi:hypothetical protein
MPERVSVVFPCSRLRRIGNFAFMRRRKLPNGVVCGYGRAIYGASGQFALSTRLLSPDMAVESAGPEHGQGAIDKVSPTGSPVEARMVSFMECSDAAAAGMSRQTSFEMDRSGYGAMSHCARNRLPNS